MQFEVVQAAADGEEEQAFVVHWLTGGIEQCCIGFLPQHLVKHSTEHDGQTAQNATPLRVEEDKAESTKNHKGEGVVKATLVDTKSTDSPKPPPKKKKRLRKTVKKSNANCVIHTSAAFDFSSSLLLSSWLLASALAL